MLTEEQKTKYLTSGGCTCPFCGSPDIAGQEVCVDAGIAWQDISCSDCGKGWQDVYTLTSVTDEFADNEG